MIFPQIDRLFGLLGFNVNVNKSDDRHITSLLRLNKILRATKSNTYDSQRRPVNHAGQQIQRKNISSARRVGLKEAKTEQTKMRRARDPKITYEICAEI